MKPIPIASLRSHGRLLGDIGEVLAAEIFDIELFPKQVKGYDGTTPQGKKVQIKATMKNSVTFPRDHEPEHYLALKILETGHLEKIFNGPGSIAAKAIRNRAKPKGNFHTISLAKLKELDGEVHSKDRLSERPSSVTKSPK